jgi:hypothetical protein
MAQNRANRGSGGRWTLVFVGVSALVAACVVVVLFWWYHRWSLQSAALLGDASAPMVGVLSLTAVAVALWSVRIQQHALEVQRQAAAEAAMELQRQQAAFEEQLKIQRDTLEVQRQAAATQAEDLKKQHHALELELQYRRHAALRDAYAPLLAVHAAYIESVDAYWKQLHLDPRADRVHRDEWKKASKTAYTELRRARQAVQLVDTDKSRSELRWYMLLEIPLEPLVDTAENQRAHLAVIHYKRLRRQDFKIQLIRSLEREFGAEVREESEDARAFRDGMLEEAREKSDAVEAAIKAQFESYYQRSAPPEEATPPEE